MKPIHFIAMALASFWLANAQLSLAAGDTATLEETRVVGVHDNAAFKSLPHSVSVITAEEIARAPYSSVAELLSREAGLTLQSFYGNDKKATIDIRGMGDTAVSNVLVLVDGVKLNEFDLSGADFSTIALSQIERVEILRGGGSVEYGDGAVGGVINIITKRGYPGQKLSGFVEATRGSYGQEDLRANLRASAGPLATTVNLSQLDTEGYRKNSDLRSRNGSIEFRLMPNDLHDLYVRITSHRDEHGFTGPVSRSQFRTESGRRGTDTPNDRGWTDDDSYTIGTNLDFQRLGKLTLQATKRQRNNDYVMSPNLSLPLDRQIDEIISERKDYNLRYDVSIPTGPLQHSFAAGANRQFGDYARLSGIQISGVHPQRKLGDIDRRGLFIKDTITIPGNLTLSLGTRVETFRTMMSDESYTRTCGFLPGSCTPYAYRQDNEQGGNWRNHGSEVGLSWKPTSTMDLFASVTRHFRSPNLDELVLSSPDLKPQQGITHEMGARYDPYKTLSLSLAVFKMRNQDEIFYGPPTAGGLSVNGNYDEPTVRKGMEFQGKWQIRPNWYANFNAAYVQPKFAGSGADVPHVPRQSANLNLRWVPSGALSWSVGLRYVGSRYDGNDLTNHAYAKLGSFTLVDTSVNYDFKQWELMAGINNLFDKAYTTMGYTQTYYPMLGRNGFVRVRYKF